MTGFAYLISAEIKDSKYKNTISFILQPNGTTINIFYWSNNIKQASHR